MITIIENKDQCIYNIYKDYDRGCFTYEEAMEKIHSIESEYFRNKEGIINNIIGLKLEINSFTMSFGFDVKLRNDMPDIESDNRLVESNNSDDNQNPSSSLGYPLGYDDSDQGSESLPIGESDCESQPLSIGYSESSKRKREDEDSSEEESSSEEEASPSKKRKIQDFESQFTHTPSSNKRKREEDESEQNIAGPSAKALGKRRAVDTDMPDSLDANIPKVDNYNVPGPSAKALGKRRVVDTDMDPNEGSSSKKHKPLYPGDDGGTVDYTRQDDGLDMPS